MRRLFSAPWLMVVAMGCASDGEPDEYRESRGRVAKFSVEQTDTYLRIATFLELRDGAVQDPKLYYYQAHQTALGWQTVEKPGRLSSPTTKSRPFLYLPVSDNIDKYLFLVCKPIPKEVREDGRTKTEYDWTDWFLLGVDAKDVAQEKPIVLPPFEKIAKVSDGQKELLDELRSRYEKARAKAEQERNTPVKNRWEQPWYRW